MKKIILCLFFTLVTLFSSGQCLNIQSTDVTMLNGGMNVNLKTIAYCGAGYLGSNYTISNNVITLDACFWFNATLPVLAFNNDFYIPLENDMPYTLNLTVYNSSNPQSCDQFSIAGTYTTEFLSTGAAIKDNAFTVFPNPTTGLVRFSHEAQSAAVYDITGRLVRLANAPVKELYLGDFPNGIYLINAVSEKGSTTQKIVLQK